MKDIKAAIDLYIYITILGTVMMVSYWAGKQSDHRACFKCGYDLMLDAKTDKVINE